MEKMKFDLDTNGKGECLNTSATTKDQGQMDGTCKGKDLCWYKVLVCMAALSYLTMGEDSSVSNSGGSWDLTSRPTVKTKQSIKKPGLVEPSVSQDLRKPPKPDNTQVGLCEGSGNAVPDPRFVEKKVCHPDGMLSSPPGSFYLREDEAEEDAYM